MPTWILILTMPSGSRYALGSKPEGLALYPIEAGKPVILKDVFGFKTELEASKWMMQTASMSEQGAKLMERVKPFLASSIQ